MRILVANRGEIACRIIRTIRTMGHTAIAVYSEADANSLHTQLADEIYLLGESPAAQSYLNVDKIMQICKTARVEAIHPGYGFLSENAAFSQACVDNGILFIGPSPQTIKDMGDKVEARKKAEIAGLPILFGSHTLSSADEAKKIAAKVGYPVLLKAKAGGGGKGMRKVEAATEIEEAFRLASSEALKAFKDGSLYMEKCLIKPRHIEVQVFCDYEGNAFTLGDRECSLQRRHQKVVEEAPAPRLSAKTKDAMASAATKLAKLVDYRGAGTIEFLVDEDENFYFLEMNTRLQVEHPVTELVFGVDLVAEQIRTALKQPVSYPLNRMQPRGHAIEVRLYAEDPDNNYAPSPGKISKLVWPLGPNVRVDEGVVEKGEISLFYDPMLAKVAAWGKTREEARVQLYSALKQTIVSGLKTNLFFLRDLLKDPAFMEAEVYTTYLQDVFKHQKIEPSLEEIALMVAWFHEHSSQFESAGESREDQVSAWWKAGLPS